MSTVNTSSIGWIDFSSEHRERLRTVLDMLSAPTVLDELGIGPVRDAFADRMFPGISTIQTRAKYFTLTACLLKRFIDTKRRSDGVSKLERYLAEEEKQCRIQLVGRDSTEIGIIGSRFGTNAKRDVVRKPSSIYWNGLRLYGMIKPRALSLAEFSQRLSDNRWFLRNLLEERGDDRGDDTDADEQAGRPRVLAPDVPANYLAELSINLLPIEADFLHRQIIATQSDSLLGQILISEANMDMVCKLSDSTFDDFSGLPFIASLKSEELRRTVQHAKDFWLIMEGAHIRYNCLLQARFGTRECLAEYEALWTDWVERIRVFPKNWDTPFMWTLVTKQGGRVKERTQKFLEAWIGETRIGCKDVKRCDQLVTDQEIFNKLGRARLRPGNKDPVRPDWVGIKDLDYRQTQVRRIVRDIRDGLLRKGDQDARL